MSQSGFLGGKPMWTKCLEFVSIGVCKVVKWGG